MIVAAPSQKPAAPVTAAPAPRLNCPWVDSPFFPRLLAEKRLDPATEAMARHFSEQGFVIIDPGIDLATLDQVTKDLAPEHATSNRVQDAWKRSQAVRSVATAPKVLDVLRTLYEREPIPFQTLNFPRGTEQKTHSDTIHFHSAPSGFMCAVWVALEDIDADNGPLHYYPKSHRSPVLDYDALNIGKGLPPIGPAGRASYLEAPAPRRSAFMRGLSRLSRWLRKKLMKRTSAAGASYEGAAAGGAELYARYEELVAELMLAHGFERREVAVKKGQALVWSANLYHGGSPIRDEKRTRHSQVTHYYFDGCMYYTPLMSAPKLGMYYMRKVRDLRTGEVVPQRYNGLELDTDAFND
jgi:ectoine hydroxylase-related dioxygenase (phytanoyl-CoA dioxygenase family)